MRRSLRGRRGALLGLPLALLLGAGVGVHGAAAGDTRVRSTCMDYALQLPALWQVQAVRLPDCGGSVLVDQYRATVRGQPITITVQSVPVNAGRTGGARELPTPDVVAVRSRSGLSYSSMAQEGSGIVVAAAAFTRGQTRFFVTVESVRGLDPQPVLTAVMDGWSGPNAAPAGP
jgi:hypothetical protein